MTLREYRERHGLSQEQFAKMIGRNQSTIAKWERGRMPDPPDLRAIDEATNHEVRADDFAGLPVRQAS